MSNSTTNALCYSYPVPELVTVCLALFFQFDKEVSLTHFFLFRGAEQESSKGRDGEDFKPEDPGSQVIDQLEEIKQGKIQGTVKCCCFHDLER